MDQLSVFVSSRLAELDGEREVAREAIGELGLVPLLWEDLPPGDRRPRETYEEEVDKCFALVAIVWQDFSEYVEREVRRAKRFNKPILAFVKETPAHWDANVRDGKLQKFIDTELTEVSWAKFDSLSSFRTLLLRSLSNLLIRSRQSPVAFHTRHNLYELGTDFTTRAKHRVAIVSRTPILLLGPRPYNDPDKHEYESRHYEALKDCVQRASEGKLNFVCGYLSSLTRHEMERECLQTVVKANLEQLSALCVRNRLGSAFTIGPYPTDGDPRSHVTYMVADNHVAMWFKDPELMREDVCISVHDSGAADALYRLAKALITPTPLEGLLENLGL